MPQEIVQLCLYLMISSCTSTISVFVLLSCGSLYSVYLRRILSISVLAYWNSLLPELKMIRAISQSQRILSSYAFFINPNLRLVKVTWEREKEIKSCTGVISKTPQVKDVPWIYTCSCINSQTTTFLFFFSFMVLKTTYLELWPFIVQLSLSICLALADPKQNVMQERKVVVNRKWLNMHFPKFQFQKGRNTM